MNDAQEVRLPDLRYCCLFLDVDGTLAELRPRPEQVSIDAQVLAALSSLHAAGIPLAVVSGRRLADIDRLLAPLRLPAAGVHGAERRRPDGSLERVGLDDGLFRAIRDELAEGCAALPGLRLENKALAFALHFREAPALEPAARQLAEAVQRRYADALTLQPGKCVYELKPRGASKGEAIRAFLKEAPFAGRRPVFVGDDLTDEAGFQVVNRLDGCSIKVGDGQTEALQRLASVDAVRDWLAALRALLDEPPADPIQQESKESP